MTPLEELRLEDTACSWHHAHKEELLLAAEFRQALTVGAERELLAAGTVRVEACATWSSATWDILFRALQSAGVDSCEHSVAAALYVLGFEYRRIAVVPRARYELTSPDTEGWYIVKVDPGYEATTLHVLRRA